MSSSAKKKKTSFINSGVIWSERLSTNTPLLGSFDELDFSAINFLSREFVKCIFQVTVRSKLNHPEKQIRHTVKSKTHFPFFIINRHWAPVNSLTLHWAWDDVRLRKSPLQLASWNLSGPTHANFGQITERLRTQAQAETQTGLKRDG